MKKITKELSEKTVKILEKEISDLHLEIARLNLDQKVNPQKDTNILPKKKKRLAVALTMLKQKRVQEAIKK